MSDTKTEWDPEALGRQLGDAERGTVARGEPNARRPMKRSLAHDRECYLRGARKRDKMLKARALPPLFAEDES